MSTLTVPFGKLGPDKPSFRNPGVIRALNVVPRQTSYGPFRELSVVSNALDARCRGAISARDASNNVFVYAADASKLYEMAGSAFTDQSKVGGYSTSDDDVTEFAVWNRTQKVIATNFTDPVQSLTIGNGSGANFADMITSTLKPKFKHVGIVGNFVMGGYTNDAVDGVKPSRLWWCAFGDETDFDPDAATQCDFDDLPDGGVIQRIVGGNEYGLVFQNSAVRVTRYIGEGSIFEILPINYAPGTPIPNSVISYKGMTFYIAEDGFMGMSGVNVDPVGSAEIDRYFWDQFDIINKHYLSAAVDPINKMVWWAFPGADASSNLPNRMLGFKYDSTAVGNRWAEARIDTELLLKTELPSYTLDGLDALGTDIDDATVFPESFDSDRYRRGQLRFAAFDQSHKLSYFTGAIKAATIETGDFQFKDGARSVVNAVRPHVDGGAPAISVASRTKLSDTITYGSASELNDDGTCPQFTDETYFHRFRVSLSASTSWSHIQGLAIEYEDGGI